MSTDFVGGIVICASWVFLVLVLSQVGWCFAGMIVFTGSLLWFEYWFVAGGEFSFLEHHR